MDTPMSFPLTRWVWQQQGLTPTQKFVLLSLADRAGDDRGCFPSVARIEQDTGYDRKAIYRALQALEEMGLIKASKKIGKVNNYILAGVLDSPSSNKKTSAQSGTRI
jgi:pyocin large subunit-like protein